MRASQPRTTRTSARVRAARKKVPAPVSETRGGVIVRGRGVGCPCGPTGGSPCKCICIHYIALTETARYSRPSAQENSGSNAGGRLRTGQSGQYTGQGDQLKEARRDGGEAPGAGQIVAGEGKGPWDPLAGQSAFERDGRAASRAAPADRLAELNPGSDPRCRPGRRNPYHPAESADPAAQHSCRPGK